MKLDCNNGLVLFLRVQNTCWVYLPKKAFTINFDLSSPLGQGKVLKVVPGKDDGQNGSRPVFNDKW